MTELGWKSEEQHVLDLPEDRKARYHRLSGCLAVWSVLSFGLPVAVVATLFVLEKAKMIERLPLPLRIHLGWQVLVGVAVGALVLCVGGAMLIRAKMKRVVTDYLDSREWS
ncbi:MAG: hypothetical protein HPY69_04395 [Armatimonadetes bacterium]|nr:hypothetical protein [Armatimonadota bacterium]